MLQLAPDILSIKGKQFAVIPWKQFEQMREALEDLEDLRIIDESRKRYSNEKGIPLEEAARRLGVKLKKQTTKKRSRAKVSK